MDSAEVGVAVFRRKTKRRRRRRSYLTPMPLLHRHLPKITIVVWTIAYLLLCARTLVLKVDKASVYHDFSTAGQNWLNGDLLYNRLGKNDFRYSPLVAGFFAPFALLPPRWALPAGFSTVAEPVCRVR
jgi:hypothetical protein